MKKIILLVSCMLLLLSCEVEQKTPSLIIDDDTPTTETPVIDEPVVTDPETEEPTTTPFGTAIMAVLNGVAPTRKLQLWDGTYLKTILEGNIKQAGNKAWSKDNVLYYFDNNGAVVASEWLNVTPDAVVTRKSASSSRSLLDPGSTTVYQDDVITLKVVSKEESYSLGGLYKPYTRVFADGVEVSGNWYDAKNQWEVDKVYTSASGHIIGIATDGSFHNVTDDKVINTIIDGGIMTYDWGTQKGYISDETGYYYITWEENYLDRSLFQKANGLYYTPNGYIWDNSTGTIINKANCTYRNNFYDTFPAEYKKDAQYPDKPWWFKGGVREENGEDVIYWVEAVTGGLYKFIPSIDSFEYVAELYEGYGNRHETSQVRSKELKPLLIENKIYFQDLGAVRSYDLDSKLVSLFAGDVEVLGW